ncbi:hypothetical protein V5738_09225 [Salinisphaera sp. SPP-AMP-43]|uniref:class I SAM-dependent methyltransferase n=1 Tax=Salinisphaera sp. SPP-AMP-43 TaxID=3121288 RepID=UPI003C6E5995
MSTPAAGSVFESDWLAEREAIDHRSRSAGLCAAVCCHLSRRSSPTVTIVDLGAGRGSNFRYLAPRLPGPQHWRLLDHDAGLLDTIEAQSAGLAPADTLETQAIDLGADLGTAIDGADLVTASALLDLVSPAWMDALAARCAAQGSALLMALSIDGHIDFDGPADPLDGLVRAELAKDQQRDKGLGPALGGRAPAQLINTLSAHGFAVTAMPSPWRLGPADADLVASLIDGWRGAVATRRPDLASTLANWAERRTHAVIDSEHALSVGHVDVLGVLGAG